MNLFVCQVCFVWGLARLSKTHTVVTCSPRTGTLRHPVSGNRSEAEPVRSHLRESRHCLQPWTHCRVLGGRNIESVLATSKATSCGRIRYEAFASICIHLPCFSDSWTLTSNSPCDFTTHGLSCVKFSFWHGGTTALPGLFGCFGFSPEQSNSTTCTSANSSPLPTSIPNNFPEIYCQVYSSSCQEVSCKFQGIVEASTVYTHWDITPTDLGKRSYWGKELLDIKSWVWKCLHVVLLLYLACVFR